MNIQLLSDLHIEFEDFRYQKCDSDVVVLAGDIHVKDRGVRWALETIRDKPVIYVLGNHEFYGKAYPRHIQSVKELCKNTNVHLLENDRVTIAGVNFFGTTLWTDFAIYGDPRLNGAECQTLMTDFKKIRVSPSFRKLRSIDVATIHLQSLKWLTEALSSHADEANVVVTHHGPSEKSLPEKFRGDIVSSAYVSDLENTVQQSAPALWLHGHLHNTSDYMIGKSRVLCNPRGYPQERNPHFDPAFCVQL